jgi:dTDP-4-amino-4,6-dideoxygalactose transaminase
MIQPFVELGLKVRFYPVGRDLSIESARIGERIDDGTLAVVLMHYFGFPQSEDLAGVLNERFPSVAIIDDRTHLLLSDLRSETVSANAVAIYSARKWGPFPDLGLVVWPDHVNEAQRSRLLDGGYDFPFSTWRLLGSLLRGSFFVCPSELLRRLSLAPFHKADAILDQRVQIRRASPLSKMLWRFWDWTGAWRARRENYQYLLSNWPSASIEPLFKMLPPSVCPLGFPIRTEMRDHVKQYLISRGIFPPIHWIRPPQLSAEEFPEATTLATQELTIPIDQRYGLKHMDHILEAACHV